MALSALWAVMFIGMKRLPVAELLLTKTENNMRE
jgi:hypothetical protein